MDEKRELVGGNDVVAQARCVFENMREVLGAGGCTFADVVKVTLYLTDVNDRPLVNPVRQEVFGDTRPASTLVEISALVIPGAKIEVEADRARPSMTGRHEIQLAVAPGAVAFGRRGARPATFSSSPASFPSTRRDSSSAQETSARRRDRVFGDLGAILAAGGCAFGDVARLNVYVTDIRDARAGADGAAARRSAGHEPPVRSSGCAGWRCAGATIEVDAVAVVR